ncbi:hypothetical protein [Thermococcus peptonophilus]|uniref:hypothetical protein n=1 Tax=Thermococcus peptonophilus TaxID=53952 RepID=UPI003465ABB6
MVHEDSTSRIVALVLILLGAILLVDSAFRVLPVVGFKTLLAVVLLVIGVVLLKEGE